MIIDAKWSNLRSLILPAGTVGRWQRINVVEVEAPSLDATFTVRLPSDVEESGITGFLQGSQVLKDRMAEAVRKQPAAFQITIADKEV